MAARAGRPATDLVVVGASLGGVEALRALLGRLPADLPAAVCAVLHLSPTRPTHLDHVLMPSTRLAVRLARNMDPLRQGCVHIAPPDHHLLIGEAHLRVLRGPREHGHRPAVDPLFRTAAHVYGPRVVGVLLSGDGSDGELGLGFIKALGGETLVQDPAEAVAPAMPAGALAGGVVDHCLPIAALAARIVELAGEPAEEAAGDDRRNA